MTAHHLSLATTIILLLPMLYFLIASLTFLLVKLDDPIVTKLLRGLVSVQFALVSIACAIGAAAFALSGQPIAGLALALVAALALTARHWLLGQLDAQIGARDAGDPAAVRRLRRLHCGGMAYNAIQFAAVVAGIPFVFGAAT